MQDPPFVLWLFDTVPGRPGRYGKRIHLSLGRRFADDSNNGHSAESRERRDAMAGL